MYWPVAEGFDERVGLSGVFTPQQDNRLAALHEAGHVIAATAFGLTVELSSTPESGNQQAQVGGHTFLSDVDTPVTAT